MIGESVGTRDLHVAAELENDLTGHGKSEAESRSFPCVLTGGLAANGNRVACIQDSDDQDSLLGDVVVVRELDGTVIPLTSPAAGDLVAPQLVGDGNVLITTQIDRSTGQTTLAVARLDAPDAIELTPFLTVDICVLRVSDDGSTYAYLSPEGLRIGEIPGGTSAPLFRRGDASTNGIFDLTDCILMLEFLFLGLGVIPCDDVADADDSGIVGLTFLFLGTADIDDPGPLDCGLDPSDDALGCDDYTECP